MKASIIIPVRDDPRVLQVVASLREQLPSEWEILVADDGAPGDLPLLEGAQIVPSHSGSPGHARNEAERLARGEVLLFLDSDVLVPPDWSRKAQSIFADGTVLAAQGYCTAVGSDPLARRMQEEYDHFVASHAPTDHRDQCDTRCFGIRRDVFERFRFDVDEPYCEDSAFGRRLFEADVPIRFVPEWTVGHHYSRSVISELSRIRRYAIASTAHFHRTGRDLFRPPGSPGPRGPGAFLLRICNRWPALGPAAAAVLWLAASALGFQGKTRAPWAKSLFSAARRVAVLSARAASAARPHCRVHESASISRRRMD